VRPTVNPAGHTPPLDFSLLVVEPRELVRHGVCLTLENAGAEIVAQVSTGARALEVAASLKPDMIILAAKPPDMSGAEATRRMVALVPGCQVLVLGTEGEDNVALDALIEGASGHLPTLGTPDHLVERVRLARAGGVPLSQSVARKLWTRLRASPGNGRPHAGLEMRSLSARELEVLRLLPTGMDNAEIARALSVSLTTVKKHVSSILEKLSLDNRVQAAVRAVRAGIELPVSRGGHAATDQGRPLAPE
jgi:DNA-binding NarL/FixJ family response regulator